MKNAAESKERLKDAEKEYEMEIQKKSWDAHMSNRVSRSKSRGVRQQVMERARSFERGADEAAANCQSLPGSRRGSFSQQPNRLRPRRSPSVGGRSLADNYWQAALENSSRPGSRTGATPPECSHNKRWASVGRLDVSTWEDKIRQEKKPNYYELRTPPSVRRRGFDPPPPPPPPQRSASSGHFREASPPLPPPPKVQDHHHHHQHLSRESVQNLQETNREQIVEQWVRQNSSSHSSSQEQQQQQQRGEEAMEETKDGDLDLEQFAMDIAETVVDNMMEKQQEHTKNEVLRDSFQRFTVKLKSKCPSNKTGGDNL